jgi:ureidoacrylate peracid hydrolase
VVELVPSETALLVIDAQNAFCHPGGTLGRSGVDIAPLAAILPNVARLVRLCEGQGIATIYTRHTNHLVDEGRSRHRIAPHTAKRATVAAQPGSWDAAFVDELDTLVTPSTHVIEKHRWSAFYGTRLDPLLSILGTRLLIVCGATTNACIDTTVRDAYMRDFDVVIARDCVAGVRQDWHEAALAVLAHYAGEIVDLSELAAQLAPDEAQR